MKNTFFFRKSMKKLKVSVLFATKTSYILYFLIFSYLFHKKMKQQIVKLFQLIENEGKK